MDNKADSMPVSTNAAYTFTHQGDGNFDVCLNRRLAGVVTDDRSGTYLAALYGALTRPYTFRSFNDAAGWIAASDANKTRAQS